MALVHKTLIGGINIDRSGNASVLFKLLILDGAVEYSQENHRYMIEKDSNLAQHAAIINNTLTAMGRDTIDPREATIVGNTLTALWASMNSP